MSLLQLVRVDVGEVGVVPGNLKMVSTDNIATITAAGYLNGVGNQLQSVIVSPNDVIECMYNYNQSTGVGNYVDLTVSINAGVITLTPVSAGVIKFMGQKTTVGGAATEAFTITGAVGATDRAFLQMVNNGTNNVTILEAVVTNNTLTVTFSGNPGNDAVFNYQLIRSY